MLKVRFCLKYLKFWVNFFLFKYSTYLRVLRFVKKFSYLPAKAAGNPVGKVADFYHEALFFIGV